MSVNFPKVLIIGHHFNLTTGGGITMTNLFNGWDKKKIAVAGERITNPDFTVCDTYYCLGYNENKRRFPFFLWQKHDKSGLLVAETNEQKQTSVPEKHDSKKKKLYNNFLHFSGLFHYSRRLRISSEFANWLTEYSPDIIYTQLSTIESIMFVSKLYNQYKLPFIIHIMDDWPSTISKKGLFQSFWNKKIDKEFRSLLNKSKTLMSISDAMSEEYSVRYGKSFIPFHNPINVNYWSKHSKMNYHANETFVILYAGRIGIGIEECFFDIAAAINELVIKGLKIEFHLQPISSSYVIDEIKKFDFIKIRNPVPYDELPMLFASVDVLILPNDFDPASISFLKYSMPTKASEYMATGTPILIYADADTAIVKHAEKNKWAYIVSENNKQKLTNAIEELYHNSELREKIGNIYYQVQIQNIILKADSSLLILDT